jgi:hypothetical protein
MLNSTAGLRADSVGRLCVMTQTDALTYAEGEMNVMMQEKQAGPGGSRGAPLTDDR